VFTPSRTLVFVTLVSAAWSQVHADDGLTVEGVRRRPAVVELADPIPDATAAIEVPWELDGLPRWSVGILAGGATQAYGLGGTGLNVDLPSRFGTMFGISGGYLSGSRRWQVEWRFLQDSASFTGLPGPITPTTLSFQRRRLDAVVYVAPFRGRTDGWIEDLSFGAGLLYQTTSATETKPSGIVVPQSQLGIELAARHRLPVVAALSLETTTTLFLPVVFSEASTAATGARSLGLAVDVGSSFSYRLNPAVDVLLGLGMRIERGWFGGPGTRGSVDASETFTSWRFPVELRTTF
jgi:hypothetical protein